MKKILFLIPFLLLLCQPLKAQVTATITDAGSQAWINGTWNVQLVAGPGLGGPPFNLISGGAVPNQSQSGTMNGSGALSVTITVNSLIAPIGSLWQFQLCPQATFQCFVTNLNITSANQNVTALLIPPSVAVRVGSPGSIVLAYADAEIVGAVPGSQYYNTTSNTQRICNGPAPCTWAALAGAGGTPAFPITVTGGISGAVPCFTSTTTESAGTLLATNAIVQGGGAGACPTTGNGDFTIDGTAHTLLSGASGLVNLSAEATNGFRIPVVASATGAITGALQFDTAGLTGLNWGTAGSTLFAVAAGSSGVQNTSCLNSNQVITTVASNAAPTCTSLSAFVSGADYTNATAAATNVTGLAFTLVASQKYAISCKLIYQGSATTTTMALTSTGPATPTKVTGQTLMDTTAGSGAAVFTQAFDGTTFAFAAGPPTAIVTTATDLYATLDVGIINGTNAGTWQLQATDGTGTLTIRQGSFCTIQ